MNDLQCTEAFAVAVLNQFEALNTVEDPVELWDTFKREGAATLVRNFVKHCYRHDGNMSYIMFLASLAAP